MRRLGGSGVSCGYSVTSCAIYLFDCVIVERGAFECKRARLCHLLCRSFAPNSSFLPSSLGPFNPRSDFTSKMLSHYGERSMVPLRSLSPFGRPMGCHNELSLRPYDDLEFRSYRWNVEPYDPPLWVSGSYSSCPGCSLCSSILAIPELPLFLSNLSYHDPYHHAHISQLYDTIHGQYMLGYDHCDMSRDMEKPSKMVLRAHRRNSYCGRGLGDIANQLKYLGRDLWRGNQRRRRHGRFGIGAYPKRGLGYYDDDLYFGGRRNRGFGGW
ncbi:hypothetical protein HBI53_065250 [Parastagonospora nodorum]|nr:hypothetical protein HBI53_065250 [Parastagonospora nodorum]